MSNSLLKLNQAIKLINYITMSTITKLPKTHYTTSMGWNALVEDADPDTLIIDFETSWIKREIDFTNQKGFCETFQKYVESLGYSITRKICKEIYKKNLK